MAPRATACVSGLHLLGAVPRQPHPPPGKLDPVRPPGANATWASPGRRGITTRARGLRGVWCPYAPLLQEDPSLSLRAPCTPRRRPLVCHLTWAGGGSGGGRRLFDGPPTRPSRCPRSLSAKKSVQLVSP